MSGDDRFNRKQTSSRSKTGNSIIILLALFAAAGIAVTVVLSHFDASMPVQLLGP
jgi:hypothetical protein